METKVDTFSTRRLTLRARSACLHFMEVLLACVSLALLSGCASHPLLAIFTPADIPRLPAPTEPSRSYTSDAVGTWAAVSRVIQTKHAVVVFSNQPAGLITFYVDFAPRFNTNHVKNQKEFIKAMAEGKEPVAASVWARFEDAARSKLLESVQGNGASQIDINLLVLQLNEVIYGSSIFDERCFSKVSIRKGTRELIQDTSSPDAIPRSNRILIEDGLPKYIRRTTLFKFRDAFTRIYTTVLLNERSAGKGTIARVTTWQNGFNPPQIDLSKEFYENLEKEVHQ